MKTTRRTTTVRKRRSPRRKNKQRLLVLAALKRSLAFALVFAVFAYTSLVNVSIARAAFTDQVTLPGNSVAAGTLIIGLEPDEDWTVENLLPGESDSREIVVTNLGTSDFQYQFDLVPAPETNDGLCQVLQIEATLDGSSLGTDIFSDLDVAPVVFSESNNEWQFIVTLPEGADEELINQTCELKFVFMAWQTNLPADQGFNDEVEFLGIFNTGEWNSGEEGNEEQEPEPSPVESAFSPIIDAYVDRDKEGSNFGQKNSLDVRSQKNKDKRTFVKFDFSFPPGTVIDEALLKLFLFNNISTRTYEAYRVLEAWEEDEINWVNKPDESDIVTDSVLTNGGPNIWLSWNVTNDVEGFVEGDPNYGWMIKDQNEDENPTVQGQFRSREFEQEDKRPVLHVSFTAPEAVTSHLVINEVYYNVGSGKGSDKNNEWVEIYNPTDSEVDITGWEICDAVGCDTIPASDPIPAKGFAVITNKDTTWNNWADMPGEAVKIVLNDAIGDDGLDNNGDSVFLKNGEADEVDAMSYGDEVSVFDPAVPNSGKGKSLARIVKGYDTDLAGDWVVNATPNPGTNPSDSGEEVMVFTSSGVEVYSADKYEELFGDNGTEEAVAQPPAPMALFLNDIKGGLDFEADDEELAKDDEEEAAKEDEDTEGGDNEDEDGNEDKDVDGESDETGEEGDGEDSSQDDEEKNDEPKEEKFAENKNHESDNGKTDNKEQTGDPEDLKVTNEELNKEEDSGGENNSNKESDNDSGTAGEKQSKAGAEKKGVKKEGKVVKIKPVKEKPADNNAKTDSGGGDGEDN